MISVFGLTVSAIDAVQILILYLVIYWLLKSAKGSRFGQALMGVGVLAAVLVGLTKVAHLEVLSRLFGFIVLYLAVSSVVIFQPEIRRLLPAIGTFQLFRRTRFEEARAVTPKRLAECVMTLAAKKLGALIAVERGISLRAYVDTGIPLDAVVTPELMVSIFTPPMPLHDGGLIIHRGRITAAHCVFPVSNQPALVVSGMRHRAAVGLSEETDALVIVVSEESGRIAIGHNGKLHRYPNKVIKRVLTKFIAKAMNQGANEEDSLSGWINARARRISALFERRGAKSAAAKTGKDAT